ncbi:MAG TPA: hypothetical protein PKN22_10715 [Taishania sp.]|nr:hypothetical protein [Taishania sp.]HNS43220.1 hypothetical protein [Taishania sp.]
MIRILFAAFLSFGIHFITFSQTSYSFSFKGFVSDFNELESKILKIDGVLSCKYRYKDEKQAGEILFELKPYEKTYDDKGNLINPSPLIQIKELFYQENLEPIELVELKN